MKSKKLIKKLALALATVTLVSCGKGTATVEDTQDSVREPYKKKYTNADFYKEGKLDPEVALAAYLDMFDYYGVQYSDFLKENLFISDFGLGDFENTGMAGVFWLNDSVHSYFGHEIYLLPGQMIGQHRHVATNYPPKYESWQVRHGWAYNFSTGEPTPNAPKIPASQAGSVTIAHYQIQKVDDIIHLNEAEAPHFLYAGPEGAIVTEYASYHDNAGLKWDNPKANFADVLKQ
ncbi:MAG: hypothetical protein ABFD09_11600 [Proteiniphilum sp.]